MIQLKESYIEVYWKRSFGKIMQEMNFEDAVWHLRILIYTKKPEPQGPGSIFERLVFS